METYYIAYPPPFQMALRYLIFLGPAGVLAGVVWWRTQAKGSGAGLIAATWSMLVPILFLIWQIWQELSEFARFREDIGFFLTAEGIEAAALLVPWVLLLSLGFAGGRYFHLRRTAMSATVRSFE